jgi:HEAT repeat protein
MRIAFRLCTLAALLGLLAAGTARSGPLTREEAARQREVLARLEIAVAAENTEAGKFAQYLKAMREDPSVDVRARVLDLAAKQSTGAELEALLLKRLDEEPDGRLRSRCAAMLGRYGSEKCLTRLVQAAATDQETHFMMGDIGGRTSARRDAVFALAELGRRLPQSSGQAIKALRDLSTTNAPPGDSLEDARVQALYQLTAEDSLLAPFRARLASADAKQRASGVVAFRFLNLHKAPPELLKTLDDPAPEVRSWTTLVLGEIGDPQTVPQLMAAAGNRSLDAATRCNAIGSLGQMKATAAAALMERLLDDPEPAVPANAAIALYRITDKKVKQFPAGYNAD